MSRASTRQEIIKLPITMEITSVQTFEEARNEMSEMRNKFVREYFDMLDEKKKSDICWSYVQKYKMIVMLNSEEMGQESKNWRKLAKEGTLKIHAYNNITKTSFDGREWHLLVITPYEYGEISVLNPDPAVAMIMKEYINGYVYFFKRKENRDNIYKYVMKGLDRCS